MPKITVDSTKDEVLAAVRQNGFQLMYASETLQNDRDIVLAAVSEYGEALEYASETLKDDREIVLAAVRNNGRALEYASETLQNDRDIVLAAVSENNFTLKYASETLQNDQFIKRLVYSWFPHAAAILRALEPLKTKLKQETNIERQAAAATMIADIEEAILCSNEQDDFDFKEAFNQALNKAKPVLEQQTGWKKLIDDMVNAIRSLFRALRGEQNRGGEQNRFSFFTNPNPNPIQEEIKEVQEATFPK